MTRTKSSRRGVIGLENAAVGLRWFNETARYSATAALWRHPAASWTGDARVVPVKCRCHPHQESGMVIRNSSMSSANGGDFPRSTLHPAVHPDRTPRMFLRHSNRCLVPFPNTGDLRSNAWRGRRGHMGFSLGAPMPWAQLPSTALAGMTGLKTALSYDFGKYRTPCL